MTDLDPERLECWVLSQLITVSPVIELSFTQTDQFESGERVPMLTLCALRRLLPFLCFHAVCHPQNVTDNVFHYVLHLHGNISLSLHLFCRILQTAYSTFLLLFVKYVLDGVTRQNQRFQLGQVFQFPNFFPTES